MKTWTTNDKSDWSDGEWQQEPDKAQWIDESTNLDCLIVRGPSGALCGYVGVPETHKFFGSDYDEVDVVVHGGLTFANECRDTGDESVGICHSEECAANKTVWWLGFDCAHSGDYCPAYDFGYRDGYYKNFNYVKGEVTRLASQLANAA